MNLTRSALGASRLTLFAAILVSIAGIFTFLNFPSQEEPSVTVRDALIIVQNPGMPVERMEQLVARPLEEQLRELPEIKNIQSTIRAGLLMQQITLHDRYTQLTPIWQRMRAKVGEAAQRFPEGTLTPVINDDFGRVAVASIAVTAPGFSISEMREPLKRLRDQLQRLPGVQNISFFGLQDERIYIDFDRARLAGLGLNAAGVLQQLQQQNVVLSGGQVTLGDVNGAVQVSGEIESATALKQFVISIPGRAGATSDIVRLGDIAQVKVIPPDPPESAAIYKGTPAVVMAVSMKEGQNIRIFGEALKARMAELQPQLPAGFSCDYVTFQADVVAHEIGNMNRVMLETIAIVITVVVLFLGWRAGVIVGSIVPLTILGTLIAMRSLGIELHMVSMAAIIIALGLLVDNGIVIAEDIERRLVAGEDRYEACIQAGQTLAIPLLTSSLVIIFAFSPFFFGNTPTNEYLRPLVIVLGLTLLGSWLLCLTVTPLLCYFFLKLPKQHGNHGAQSYNSKFYGAYRKIIGWALNHKAIFAGSMVLLLSTAVAVLATVPESFLPKSDRTQFQITLQLAPGTDSRVTLDTVQSISRWLDDKKSNPEVTRSIGYVADGGPRIILGLNPPLPAAHVAYFTVSVVDKRDLDKVIERTRNYLETQHPEVRGEPKRFSMGANDSGTVAYRISGPDEAVLRDLGGRIRAALQSIPNSIDVYDDWDNRVPRIDVLIDQRKARRLGVTSEDVAYSLQGRFSGIAASVLRDGDTLIPIMVRGSDTERKRPEDIASSLIHPSAGGVPVPLSAVAEVSVASEPSVIRRRNLIRTLTVQGRNTLYTSQQVVDQMTPFIASLKLPAGYKIELGAEIEESAEANEALGQYLPHALIAMLLLFIWQFNSFRKLALIISIIPFGLIGVAVSMKISGEPLGFLVIFGLLSLAGIIVNNAVLLLERIEAELREGFGCRQAVINAAVKRLRPIVMTKLTCITGLIPLLLFGGPLWSGMAVSIIGGLSLGTLVTLGLVPVLYEWLFDGPVARFLQRFRQAESR
ncbi:efflux RND transporter permease subunit [Uliginosibacterium gangwonense]|uniref:efflux RND transporter permease subunit n=1 Tax=Uliginosibacterium gangwonense TaxID=392736 RepID=UPI00036083A0|nr:efflux RND transporter permease subunit [Uliginosibacterium gangwonense]